MTVTWEATPLVTSPTVTPIVELGLGDTFIDVGEVGLWQTDPPTGSVTSRWQDATSDGSTDAATSRWVADQPFWVDVSCHVREVSTFAGRERADETWEVGTATIIVDNVGGWADFPYGTDPELVLYMRPGRQVRISVSVDDGVHAPVVYKLWGGYVDGMSPGFDPEDGEFVTIECIDAKGEAGRGYLGLLAAPVGAGEVASTRVARILNSANWPASRRSIQTTSVPLLATTYDAQVVDLLNLAADSAGGAVFGDIEGRVAFRQRDWQATAIGELSVGSINNTNPNAACAVAWEQAFNREDISTRVTVGNPDGVPYTVRNTEAFTLYGEETFERTDLETQFPADLKVIGDRVLEVRSPDYMPRIAAVTLHASESSHSIVIMGLASPFVPTTVHCAHQGVDGRTVFNRTMMVVGAEHIIHPEDGWECRLALDDVRPFQIGAADGIWSDGTAPTAYWQPTEPTPPTPPAFVTRWSPGV